METVTERELSPTIWVSAEVISINDSRLSAEISGRLKWVAEVGTFVEQGETLAQIDSTLLQQQLNEQNAVINREKSRLSFLSAEVKRLKSLVTARNISQSNLDKTISDKQISEQDLIIAQARLSQIEEQLNRAKISAPFSGVVTKRLLQAGEWADSGEHVIHLVDPESQEIRGWIPANYLPYININDQLKIKSGKQQYIAEVTTIVPVGDEESRLLEIRLQSITKFSIAQSLKIAIPTAQPVKAVSVPRDALVLRRTGTAIFRVVDNKAQKIEITTGIASNDYIQVIGDVNQGDAVIINGGERLRPGQSVRIINQDGNAQ